MSENSVDPEIIKRTQDTLGQIISAPALTERLLSRPPVQFLQDIVKAVRHVDFVRNEIFFLLVFIRLGDEKDEFSSRFVHG